MLKCCHNWFGKHLKNAQIVHGVKCGRGRDGFSVAFTFRHLQTTAVVDSVTNQVAPPVATTKKESNWQEERAAIRMTDLVPVVLVSLHWFLRCVSTEKNHSGFCQNPFFTSPTVVGLHCTKLRRTNPWAHPLWHLHSCDGFTSFSTLDDVVQFCHK